MFWYVYCMVIACEQTEDIQSIYKALYVTFIWVEALPRAPSSLTFSQSLIPSLAKAPNPNHFLPTHPLPCPDVCVCWGLFWHFSFRNSVMMFMRPKTGVTQVKA